MSSKSLPELTIMSIAHTIVSNHLFSLIPSSNSSIIDGASETELPNETALTAKQVTTQLDEKEKSCIETEAHFKDIVEEEDLSARFGGTPSVSHALVEFSFGDGGDDAKTTYYKMHTKSGKGKLCSMQYKTMNGHVPLVAKEMKDMDEKGGENESDRIEELKAVGDHSIILVEDDDIATKNRDYALPPDSTSNTTSPSAERLENERIEQERLAAEETTERKRLELERIEHEKEMEQQGKKREEEASVKKLEEERLEHERLAAEERIKQERLAAEEAARQAEVERLEQERIEREMALELERKRKQKEEKEEQARKLEEERLERERLATDTAAFAEAERLENELLEQERIVDEKMTEELK